MTNIEILIPAEEISKRVKELAAEISRDYAGKTITLICALKGAMFFVADLSREIQMVACPSINAQMLDVRLEFIKVSSYGNASESSGKITLEYPETLDLKDKDVIIVEDIVDMGYTACWLKKYLQGFEPASLKFCALLDKPSRRRADVDIEYLGFTVPNEFIVGYGLDYAQKYRCLPYIGKVLE